MMELDLTFEENPWEAALSKLDTGEKIDGATFLTLTEQESEEGYADALRYLEQNGICLCVDDLPKQRSTGEAAQRLRLEEKLVQKGNLLMDLEETEPLRLYLEELTAMPVAGDVNVLAEAYSRGDEAVMQQLVDLSLSRCVELAMEMTGRGVLLLDLIQEASLGLWQGILCYSGGDFEAHRDWWIRQYLARAVLTQARDSGLGRKLQEGMEDYRNVDQQLLSELGRNPTLEEIAEAMHITAEDAAVYSAMLSAARTRQQVDMARQPKEEDPEEEQAVEDTAYFQSRQRILEMLSTLTEQESQLLILRFGLEGGLPLTPEQTAAKLGLTPREVVELEGEALAKLRTQS